MISQENIISFVINLNNYKINYYNQYPLLRSVNINAKRFNAINALNNEHIEYKNIINIISYYICPKCIIGCSLSHILLAKYLYNNYSTCKNIYFLILEDDAFPCKKYQNNPSLFWSTLNHEIENINIIDKDWDIIQLHSDGPFDTNNTYSTHLLCGSTAAYLISINGLEKLINEYVTFHIDFITQNCLKYRKYRCKQNLFYTNEKSSLNREMNCGYSTIIKSYIFDKIFKLRGEKIWEDYLNFKTIRLPIINKELTVNNIIDILLFFILYKINTKKYIK